MINEQALALIRRFEGLRLKAYRDAGGVWTIGYGHTSRAGPQKVRPGMRITRAEAEEILRRDVQRFARQVAEALGEDVMRRLNENQFGALVSFAYNVGIGNFRRSSVFRAVRDGRYDDVPRLLMRWTKAGGRRLRGLERRRRAEGKLFTTPVRQLQRQAVDTLPPPATKTSDNAPARPEEPPPTTAPATPPRKAAPPRAAFFMSLFALLSGILAAIFWRNRIMRAIRRFCRRCKGWRTFAFALLLATLGVAEATDWAQLVPDGPNKGWYLFAIGLAVAWLRFITTTPPGRPGIDEDQRP